MAQNFSFPGSCDCVLDIIAHDSKYIAVFVCLFPIIIKMPSKMSLTDTSNFSAIAIFCVTVRKINKN